MWGSEKNIYSFLVWGGITSECIANLPNRLWYTLGAKGIRLEELKRFGMDTIFGRAANKITLKRLPYA